MNNYTYQINEHQEKIRNEISQLPTESMYYIVVQQNIKGSNFSLNELKKHIRRSTKEYVKRRDPQGYYSGKENDLIKYLTIFETTHDFFMSQHTTSIVKTDFYSGFHFHLFITGVREDYINQLTYQLNSQKNKHGCISKIDGVKKEKLDHDFILYHTKQMMFRYSPQLILKN